QVREAEASELVLRGSGRDRVRLPSGLLDLGQGVLPARADADVEARRIETDIGAHDARELDIADLVVPRIIPIDPALLHEAGLETERRGHGRGRAGVGGVVAAARREGVRARGEAVGNAVLELARPGPTEGETGADVCARGPRPGPAEGLAQSLQCVHGAGSEGERVALEVRDGHGVLCSLDMCWITPCGMQYITY